MPVIGSPANPAFDFEAERVECTLKNLVSIPATLRTFLIDADIVKVVKGLWGSTKVNKS